MLMAAGEALPRQVFGHGWVHFKGEKMSKSLGTAVDPLEAADRLGADPLRLYLVKEVPYGGDGDFSWERFEERYNADLANNLGNLVSRVASMAERYAGGRVAPTGEPGPLAARGRRDAGGLSRGDGPSTRCTTAPTPSIGCSARPTSTSSRPAVDAGQGSRGSPRRLGQVLFDVAETVRVAAVLLLPIMPGVGS